MDYLEARRDALKVKREEEGEDDEASRKARAPKLVPARTASPDLPTPIRPSHTMARKDISPSTPSAAQAATSYPEAARPRRTPTSSLTSSANPLTSHLSQHQPVASPSSSPPLRPSQIQQARTAPYPSQSLSQSIRRTKTSSLKGKGKDKESQLPQPLTQSGLFNANANPSPFASSHSPPFATTATPIQAHPEGNTFSFIHPSRTPSMSVTDITASELSSSPEQTYLGLGKRRESSSITPNTNSNSNGNGGGCAGSLRASKRRNRGPASSWDGMEVEEDGMLGSHAQVLCQSQREKERDINSGGIGSSAKRKNGRR
jgi:hypothetical protein